MRDIISLLPKVQRLCAQFLAEAQKQGMPLILTQTYRTIEEQNALYAQGRTKPGKIVTNAKGGQSLHNWRVAFDVCFLVGKKASYTGDWKKLGLIAQKLGLEWGGNWTSFPDKPHFQYLAGYQLKDFINKKVDLKKFK